MLPVWLTDTVTTDIDRAVKYTLLWGLEGVELRTVGGANHQVPFVNELKIKRRLAEHDLPIVAVVPGLFEGQATDRATWMNQIVALDETLQFCQRMGCRLVVASGFQADGFDADIAVDVFQRAGRQAAKRKITLAVLNEQDMAYAKGETLGRLLDAVDHPHVKAAWNPVAAVRAGEDADAGLKALAGHVALVRCRNGKAEPNGWTDTLLEQGAINWGAQGRMLHAQGFEGPVSLEVHLEPKAKRGVRLAGEMIACLGV